MPFEFAEFAAGLRAEGFDEVVEVTISAMLELSCTRSKMISVPSGETSKSPITKLDGRSVSWC